LIGQHRSKQRAQLNQLMPVFIGSRQSTQLDSQNDADVIKAQFGQEALKATSTFRGRTALTLIFVDHLNAFRRPTKPQGQLDKRVLPSSRLSMVEYLVSS
jgi:hypothetical protein